MIYLADEQSTEYKIVIRKDATESEKTAAAELAKYLKIITRADFPTVTDDAPAEKREIVVGYCDRPGCKPQKKLGDDGYTIKVSGDRLLILGSGVRGALYGVYTFLEKYCGCRFFTPDCERIPTVERTLYLSSHIELTEIPVFEYRNVYWYTLMTDEIFCAKMKNNGGMGHPITDKVGGAIHYNGGFCHTIPELAETGNIWDMPCLCDEDIYQTTLKNVRRKLREEPDKKIISISQVDGNNGECSCDKCRAVFEEDGSHIGTLIRFINRIKEDIRDEFPDVVIDTLAYQYTRNPPKKTKPHDGMIVRLCNVESCFRHPITDLCHRVDPDYGSFPDNLRGWSKICRRLYIWDYTTNFTNMSTLFPNLMALRPNMRLYADNNVVGVFSQGNSSDLNGELGELRAYLLAKLQWNPYMGESEYRMHMEDFCRGYYGEGGKYILQLVDLIHLCSEDGHMNMYFDNSANIISVKGYSDRLAGCFAFYDRASALFDRAEAETWGAGDKIAYANLRRSRISLHNYHNFILKSALERLSDEDERRVIERAIIDNNREQYVLMREYDVKENREFHRLDFSEVPDFSSYALKW